MSVAITSSSTNPASITAADNWLKTYPVGSNVSGSSSAGTPLAVPDRERGPLPHAVHREDGGLLEGRGKKSTRRVGFVVGGEDDALARTGLNRFSLLLRGLSTEQGRAATCAAEDSWRASTASSTPSPRP